MAKKEKKKYRAMWEGDVVCGHCNKSNKVKVGKKIIEPGVKEVSEMSVEVVPNPELDLEVESSE